MSLPDDLLEQARHLATRERRKPKQASLRRAVSAAYYALFHLLTDEAASLIAPGQSVLGGLRVRPRSSPRNDFDESVARCLPSREPMTTALSRYSGRG